MLMEITTLELELEAGQPILVTHSQPQHVLVEANTMGRILVELVMAELTTQHILVKLATLTHLHPPQHTTGFILVELAMVELRTRTFGWS